MRKKRKAGKEWDIRKHAVVRFRQRFLRKTDKDGRRTPRGKRYRDKEVRRIMHYYLGRAKEFAVEKDKKNSVIILMAKSEYGNIYFITRGRVVHTVYPGSYVARRLRQGTWNRV